MPDDKPQLPPLPDEPYVIGVDPASGESYTAVSEVSLDADGEAMNDLRPLYGRDNNEGAGLAVHTPVIVLSNEAGAPLGEILFDETRPHRERMTALIDSLNASRIDSDETKEAVATLGGMLRELRTKVETDRKTRAEPFDEGKAAVQRVFKAGLIDHLDAAMESARKMLDEWRTKQDAIAAAERKRQEEAAAEAQRIADEAAAAKEAAQAKGDVGAAISAEIAEVQARERAERLAAGEGIVRPSEPIRTHAGSATTNTQKQVEITDMRACVAWLMKSQRPALQELIGPLVTKLARAGMDIPGVKMTAVQTTRFRR